MVSRLPGLHGGSEDAYRHRNRSFNEQVAFYTQATFELNDQFAIVAGIRYAKDDKEALERRVAYAEIALASAFSPILVGSEYDSLGGLSDEYGSQCRRFSDSWRWSKHVSLLRDAGGSGGVGCNI